MKIAMIGHKRVPGREGGVEVVVEELSRRLVEVGHRVTLYNRSAPGVKPQKRYEGARIITVPTIDKKNLDAVIYSFLATLHAVFLRRYDVIHFHALGPSVMLALAHFFGKRTVATVHGLDWQRGKWGGFGKKYLKLGEKVIAKYADRIIVLSPSIQEYFKKTYDRDTDLIANGVSAPLKTTGQLLEEWDLEPKKYILFMARIVPEKGLHYLLDAYSKVETDVKLVVAGGDSHSGGYFDEVRQRAYMDRRVVLTGFVEGQFKAELLANAALYVLPSDIEGMPISLLEAMSYGTPCLTSDIEENTHVLSQFGATFKKGDVADLQRALTDALAYPPRAGEDEANMIRREHSWDQVARETLEVYEEL